MGKNCIEQLARVKIPSTKVNALKPTKLALASFDYTRPKDPPISLGAASIEATLRRANVDVVSRSWAVNKSENLVESAIEWAFSHTDKDEDLVLGMGAYVWNENEIQMITKELKKLSFPGTIILGGPQISYSQTSSLKGYYPYADGFIRGNGELALLNYKKSRSGEIRLNPLEPGLHVPGIFFSDESASPQLSELESPFLSGIIRPQTFIRWETQRGCPFECSFCQHKEVVKLKDPNTRFFLPSRIEEEIKWIGENRVIQDIAVLDPTFNSGSQYLEVLKGLCDIQYDGKISFQIRPEMMKDEFYLAIQTLSKTAKVQLEFGLQTAVKEEMREINRHTVTRVWKEKVQRAMDIGVDIEVSLIFGLPHQTISSFKQSIKFCNDVLNINLSKSPLSREDESSRSQKCTVKAFPLMLLRGTKMHDRKEELQLVEDTDNAHENIDRVQDNRIPHVISSPSFTYADWKEMSLIAANL